MSDTQYKAEGTFTQIPNVYFDTCDLPETAQILFLRLFRTFGHRGEIFTGSIRKLSTLVRLPKSTVDRGLKLLKTSRLILIDWTASDEEVKAVMTITLNLADLWRLNKAYHAGYAVPIWDKEMPECPNVGQGVPQMGQHDINLGQRVPDVSTKVATIQINTSNTNSNTEERSDLPIYSLEEKQLLDWYERLGTGYTPKPETAKRSLPDLLEHVHSFEDMQSLHDFTAPRIRGEDKIVYLANMTKFIKMWLKNKPAQEAPEMPELTAEESEQEVLWTSWPSTIEQLFAQQATMEIHMSTLGKNLRMMSRGEARDFYYDMPNVQHYTPEQVQWYKQRTETRELVRIPA